ncbi:acyl carrier protein [Acrasis kona]|uniref:Acyl carrier protein n=1 Tax=Acrasis kona TaxID=1008807 RepID=A0AAW2Z506_9EUKA
MLSRLCLTTRLVKPSYRHYAILPQVLKATSPHSYLNKTEVTQRVLEHLKKDKRINKKTVNENSHFIADMGLDELDVTSILQNIEKEFAIVITGDLIFLLPLTKAEEDADSLWTVSDVITHVTKDPTAKAVGSRHTVQDPRPNTDEIGLNYD